MLFDQRGCGESLPHASDPAVGLEHNTTEHLIGDMEKLREHLGIDQWLLYGGSWGSTLILAYAQCHPERVGEIILVGVTTTTRDEIDWLYRGSARFVPAQWEAFRDAVPEGVRTGNLVADYNRLLNSDDEHVRRRAARDWCAWEDALISHESLGTPGQYSAKPDAAMMAMTRICAHYFAHAAWLEEGQLLREAYRLSGIPGILIHGRLDISSPVCTAWELAKAWPGAELRIIDESGHTGSPAMRQAVLEATQRFGAIAS